MIPPSAMVTKKAPRLNKSKVPSVTLVEAGGAIKKHTTETIEVVRYRNKVELTKKIIWVMVTLLRVVPVERI